MILIDTNTLIHLLTLFEAKHKDVAFKYVQTNHCKHYDQTKVSAFSIVICFVFAYYYIKIETHWATLLELSILSENFQNFAQSQKQCPLLLLSTVRKPIRSDDELRGRSKSL